MIEAIPASNDVNLPGLATTETLTRHVNLNYFSEAVSWEAKRGWRMPIPGGSRANRNYRLSTSEASYSVGRSGLELRLYLSFVFNGAHL